MNVAVIGASGYSGEELVRLLARHPRARLAAVTSRSLAGQSLAEAMPSVRHAVGSLRFEGSDGEALAGRTDLEIFFLALPHGVAAEFAGPLVAAGKTVIDLSPDFRLRSAETYGAYYGREHPAPELLETAPYVIPELADDAWTRAPLIACPGCYPTSVLLPLVPLLREQLVEPTGIIAQSASGVTGAGRKVAEAFLFGERNESMKAYGLPRHRHLSEIEEQLSAAAGEDVAVQFTPHLAPMSRGIATTVVARPRESGAEAVEAAWDRAFAGRPFAGRLPSGTFPDTRHVSGTNRVDFSAVHDARTGNLLITSAVDNLQKGAAGQAVQIMNLKYGFPETEGLL